jgi:putative transposase
VQSDDHALTVLRYIEANPLRAGMVQDLREYPWSSYAKHGLGQDDALLAALPWAERLGAAAEAQQAFWRTWVHTPLTERELAAVRRSVTSGRPYGTAPFSCGGERGGASRSLARIPAG